MSKELSLETRVSSAFVQGKLEELLDKHQASLRVDEYCPLAAYVRDLLNEWKQAEADLAEARAELAVNNEKESK